MSSKLTIIGVICVVAIGGCILTDPFDPCANEIKREVFSPDGKLKAVIFLRDCGATTSFSTQISLLRRSDNLPKDSGNVFICDEADLQVKWLSTTQLKIVFPNTQIYKRHNVKDGVLIVYAHRN